MELPEYHAAIPDSQWFWNHRRDTIDCEAFLFEVVNLANYVINKADCKLYINQYPDALLLYKMLVQFSDKQAARPAIVEYLDDAETQAVHHFDRMCDYCSDGLLIARLLTIRPSPRFDQPPQSLLGQLFVEDYRRTPTRSLCFALVYASRRQVPLARRIVRDALEEYEAGAWNFPAVLNGLFRSALDLLNRFDEPTGLTDYDERRLWSLIPQNRDMTLADVFGVAWQTDDVIAE